ncbi:hypothetical protein BSKO_13148 [Bryopsis sp. KO-2023]|nr:hypothetical protein BSKO_13148 [Bryopsis sp. KO-2023]
MASSVSFNDLDPSCLKQIFSFLRGDDCARLACTAPLWRDAAGASDLWEGFIQQEYHQEAGKLAEVSDACSSTETCRETYQKLHLLRWRARKMWKKLEGWCTENATQISESLQAGATEAQIQEVERELDVTFPEAFKQIYRVHNGQLLNYDQCLDDDNNGSVVRPDGSIFAGLFGGYSFYNHFVCTRMLPLKRMVKWTKWMRESDRMRERGSGEKRDPDEHHYVLFAASYVFNKAFFLDTRDASVHAWTVDRIHFMRAIPEQRASGVLDGILRWMEVYADRLQDGTYQMTALLDDGEDTTAQQMDPSRGICLFPVTEPGLATAVTRGVQVRTSSLFAPELSMVSTTGNATFTLAYSVEFSLLQQDQEGTDEALDRVKLRSRHWSVLDGSGKEFSTVNGAAVVGKYPDLVSGEGVFRYQSCSRQANKRGYMEGSFIFTDISGCDSPISHSQEPGGNTENDFTVVCPRFHTNVPDVIF